MNTCTQQSNPISEDYFDKISSKVEHSIRTNENISNNTAINDAYLPVQTSIMGPIDCHKLEVSGNINKIVRKTKDNIVNINHEQKADELSLFYLYPHSVNGLNEETRQVPLSPLDYYQYHSLRK
ncbi:uncharacterized protein TNCV_4404721 [Trichonephila clavipes]|uniref:Uncharacterized protein n=1 Tax=Trichonephila clavipes TaxID=2585209 RepID=A0A8X6S6Z5_TRICX|nr:uncharacterized protein TNCV_4404721 [Trichonephila clavipes]